MKKGEQPKPAAQNASSTENASKKYVKKEFVPGCFREASENQEIVKMRDMMQDAYLTNKIDNIQKAVEQASAMVHEGNLDKVIEACKNRIEKL